MYAPGFFSCWLLNFYVHIHWAMACININNLNFVSAHLVGISSIHIYIHYMCCLHYVIFFFCFVSKIVFFFCFISFNSRNLLIFLLDRISVATTMHWHWPWHWCSTQISNQRATKTVLILKKKKKLHSELCTECEFWITNKNLLILSHESERCTEHIEYICIKIALTATKDSKRKRKKNCRRQIEVKRKERIECQRRRKSTNKTTIECID